MDLTGAEALEFLRQTDRLSAGGPDAWMTACRVTAAVIPADVVTLNHVDIVAGVADVVVTPEVWEERMGRLRSVTERYAHQHPMIEHHAAGKGEIPMRIDLAAAAGFTDTELYREYYAPLGLRHQLMMEVPTDETSLVVIVLSATDRAYSERDEAMLLRLKPHLSYACRTFARSRLPHDGGDAGWVVVSTGEDGRVAWVSEADTSGTFRVGEPLPEGCESLRAPSPRLFGEQVMFGSGATRWFVRAIPGDRSPVLLAQRVGADAKEPVLTARQSEVLKCIADGMSNREIARALSIGEGTVRKHIENIYRTLQVGTRMDAAKAYTNRLMTSAYSG